MCMTTIERLRVRRPASDSEAQNNHASDTSPAPLPSTVSAGSFDGFPDNSIPLPGEIGQGEHNEVAAVDDGDVGRSTIHAFSHSYLAEDRDGVSSDGYSETGSVGYSDNIESHHYSGSDCGRQSEESDNDDDDDADESRQKGYERYDLAQDNDSHHVDGALPSLRRCRRRCSRSRYRHHHHHRRLTPHSLDSYHESLSFKLVYRHRSFMPESCCSHNHASVPNAIHIPLPPSCPFSVQDVLLAIQQADAEIKDYSLIQLPRHSAKGTHLLEVGLDCWTNCLRLANQGLVVQSFRGSSPSRPVSPTVDTDADSNSGGEESGSCLEEHHRLKVLLPRTSRWRQLMRVHITGIRLFLRHQHASAYADEDWDNDDSLSCIPPSYFLPSMTTSSSLSTLSLPSSHPPSSSHPSSSSTSTFTSPFPPSSIPSSSSSSSKALVHALRHRLGPHRELISLALLGVHTTDAHQFVHCDQAVALVRVYVWDGCMLPCCLRLPALSRAARAARRQAGLLHLQWTGSVEICPADRHARWVLLAWLLVLTCVTVILLA